MWYLKGCKDLTKNEKKNYLCPMHETTTATNEDNKEDGRSPETKDPPISTIALTPEITEENDDGTQSATDGSVTPVHEPEETEENDDETQSVPDGSSTLVGLYFFNPMKICGPA